MPHCNTCKHLDSGSCTRYPRWEPVIPEMHYCGEHKPKPKKKPASEISHDVPDLMEHYQGEFIRVFNVKPAITAADGSAAKKLLASYSLSQCRWIISEYLARPPQFYREKGLKALRHILSAVNNGMIIDRMGSVKQSVADFVEEQMRTADPQHEAYRSEYEQFLRTTNERMTLEKWIEEFKEDINGS